MVLQSRCRFVATVPRRLARLALFVLLCLVTIGCRNGAKKPTAARPDSDQIEVLVVGGGIAGLTAAAYLAAEDVNVVVLEKNERVGGRALSGDYKGFHYAKGAEYLGPPEGVLKELLAELKLRPQAIPSPMDAHWRKGKFYYGEDGLARLWIEHSSVKTLNRFMQVIQRYAEDYAEVPEFELGSDIAKLDGYTARQFFVRNQFPAIYQETYNVGARGLFGANIDEISALSYIPEIAFDFEDAEPIENTNELSDALPKKGAEKTGAYSFTKGIAELTTGIAKALGRRVRLNAKVTTLQRRGDGYEVAYESAGKTQTVTAKAVILAVPAPVVLRIAASALDDERKRILEKIPYSSYMTVALFSKEPIFDKAFDLSVPDGMFFTDIYDATWIQRHYDATVRNRRDSVLVVYIAPSSYKDRSLLQLSDQQVLDRTYRDLEKVFPGIRSKVVGHDLQRFTYAYPVMTLGAYGRLSKLHKYNRGTLLLAGDYTIYPTFEAAADSGALAAKKALATLRRKR